MRKIITLLIMALLMAGTAVVDAKVNKRQTKKKRQTTTATTKTRKKARPAAQQILPPQREITEDMLRTAERNGNSTIREAYKEALDGDASQQHRIALIWATGDFGEEDRCEALRWYYLAAKQGYADAEFEIADSYNDSSTYFNCVKKNDFEAAKWYARAHAHGNEDAIDYLGILLKYGCITNEEFRIANELANNDVSDTKDAAIAANDRLKAEIRADKKRDKFYGQWTSARGTTFTIERGPYLNLVGAGKFSGEWTNDGKLYVSFGYPDEITLRYSDGFLYDGNGRMYWRVGQ